MPFDRRTSRIKKGMFLTSTPAPDGYTVKRTPLPDDLQEFKSAAAVTDDLAVIDRAHASAVAEISRRLQRVRDELAPYKAKPKMTTATWAMWRRD